MKIATLGFSLLLGTSPLIAHADISGSVDIQLSVGAPGVEIDSVDVFYDQLAPHGVWIEEPRVGLAFIPDEDGFVPYRDGRWEYTDVGMVWISDEPHGWATTHYGRWFFSSEFGRWVWVPDTQWGPSWVDWYEAENTFGWVPMAPEVIVSYGYEHPVAAWHYCPSDRLFDRNVDRYYVPRDRVRSLQSYARPVAQRASFQNRTIVVGPAPERLRAHRIAVQRQPIQRVAPARQLGRPSATEARQLTQRAQQRRPQVEQQNDRRIEQRAAIKRVVQQRQPAAQQPQVRPTPTRPAQPQRDIRPAQPQRDIRPAQPQRDVRPAQPQRDVRPQPQPQRDVRPAPPQRDVRPAQPQRDVRPAPPQRDVRPAPPQRDVRPQPQRDVRPQPQRDVRPAPPQRDVRPQPQRDVRPAQPQRDVRPQPQRDVRPAPPQRDVRPPRDADAPRSQAAPRRPDPAPRAAPAQQRPRPDNGKANRNGRDKRE